MTVSVKGDLSVESQDLITNWVRKNTVMHYMVIETGESGRRHMHALFVFKTPRDPRKIKDNVWTRMVQPHHSDSLARIAVKVQVCPGNKWYDEYLQKEPGRELISNTWDPESAQEYFPTEQIQEALVAKSKLKGVACPWIDLDIVSWTASTYENTPTGALMFLKDRMFVARNMVPIADKRKLTEKALMYWEYRNGVVSPSPKELQLLHMLEHTELPMDGYVQHAPTGNPGNSKKLWKDKDFSEPPSI